MFSRILGNIHFAPRLQCDRFFLLHSQVQIMRFLFPSSRWQTVAASVGWKELKRRLWRFGTWCAPKWSHAWVSISAGLEQPRGLLVVSDRRLLLPSSFSVWRLLGASVLLLPWKPWAAQSCLWWEGDPDKVSETIVRRLYTDTPTARTPRSPIIGQVS